MVNDPLRLSGSSDSNDSSQQPRSQWRSWHIIVILALTVATILIIRQHNPASAPYQKVEGAVFGTFYHVTYQSGEALKPAIDAALQRVDESLSMFNKGSIISRINRNEDVEVDSLFRRVFELSQAVSATTSGAFDITVAPLVNAWGFGYKNGSLPTDAEVDSLRQLVGWERVSLSEDGHIHKADTSMVLDFSAVAKGFAVDLVAEMLSQRGIQNYMVEIGGEVIVHGVNPDGNLWRVGISKPIEDVTGGAGSELQAVLPLSNRAMATSGNYRNFYITEDGRKLAHTIDPKTGYPVQHSLLSSTVFAPTCAEADAFATSFMVMGLDSAKLLLQSRPDIQVYFIYDSLGTTRTFTNMDIE
ncbi:MAG: FAD:protein FMN transferase [Bacteroidaceae bacterium]|nr:FAD:protein FMN transferase [Bacteroidaceae bacterium]